MPEPSATSLAVGVDVGGTKIAAGVVDRQGRILEKQRRSSPTGDEASLHVAIRELVADLRERHDVAAVGVGAPGFVADDRRRVLMTPNLPWRDEPVADLLERDLGLPVWVENDALSAAWAESRFGAGREHADQLTVTLGTGIGGGLVLDGRPYRGGHGVAAEIGHLLLVRDGRPCPCGRRGCWEQYASGSALQRDAREAAAAGDAAGLLEAAGGEAAAVTGSLVTELARQGDESARRLVAAYVELLAAGLATLVAVLDPRLVVLGGGVSEAGDLLLQPTREALAREAPAAGHRPLPDLRTAELGNDAGLIGVADLARRDE